MREPIWFHDVLQQRLDTDMVQIERHPELRKLRSEEQAAFDAMFANGEKASLNGYRIYGVGG